MSELQTPDQSGALLARQPRKGLAVRVASCAALSALTLALVPSLAGASGLPPLVQAKPAVQISGGFELKGRIHPYGLDTHYHFEYGPTTSYGTNVPIPEADAGSANEFVPVSQTVTGLQPSTTYHFRLVASNSAGQNTSEDETFTTPANSNTPSNQFSIGSATTKGSTATLAISVPDPGTVSATGKDLKSASATASGAGTVKLKMKLNGAGSKALKKAKGHKLRLKVKISFLPSGGSAASATKTLTFKAGR